jgi:ketosteroid isomerase-like protein
MRARLMPLSILIVLGCFRAAAAETTDELAQQVRTAETAFAATMADRDLQKFASYVDEEAVFFGGEGALRGKAAVVERWKAFFDGPNAPFSWTPETVEVLASGTLALSSGPVHDPAGKRVGTFNSIWRRGADGAWRVVFDKGCDPCRCAPPQQGEPTP